MDTVLCCSLDSLCFCSDLSIQTGPLREYGVEDAVMFRLPVPVSQTGVGHSSVRVGLSSYSEAAERVYAAALLVGLPTPNNEEPMKVNGMRCVPTGF